MVLNGETYDLLWLSCNHDSGGWQPANNFDITVSFSHMIDICHLYCQFLTSKGNESQQDVTNGDHVISCRTIMWDLPETANGTALGNVVMRCHTLWPCCLVREFPIPITVVNQAYG
uniref:Uncharacterized protein n=1 Tax=Micrurus corallinus TaxID=54390 RepID=A0A2D4GQQ0_MICCO